MHIILVLIGFIGGVIGGMGMGGGTLLIPLLVQLFGYNQQTAQCINLVSFIPMSILALYIHYRTGLVNSSGKWRIVLSAIILAIPVSAFAQNIECTTLSKFFGIFLALIGVISMINGLKRN